MNNFPKFDRSFDNLKRLGFIDTTSGAWDYKANVRAARCGRCRSMLKAGEGKPYNQFMADGYHATTKYLCAACDDWNKRDEVSYHGDVDGDCALA